MLPTEYPSWKEGKEYKTEVYTPNWTTLLRKTEQTWANTTPSWWGGSSDAAPTKLSHVTETTNTIADVTPNLVSAETFAYDSYNNLTDTYSYDFGSGSAGSLLRRSHTDYVTSSNYTSYSSGPYLISLPSESWVSSDSSGTYKVSLTQYEYDNYSSDSLHAGLIDRSSITGHDSAYDTSKVYRGNVTKVTTYANAGSPSGAIHSAAQYDIAGNVVKTIDPRVNATTIAYEDCFGAPNGNAQTPTTVTQLSGNSTFALPTSSTRYVNSQPFTTYTQFDYSTGKPVDAEDIIGTVTSAVYDDDLDRQTQVIVANNVSALQNQTTIAYDDTNRKITVTSDLRAMNDNRLKSESFYDGFGRTTETRKYDLTTYSAVRTEYDALGRAYKSSNPFRPALSESPVWTTSAFDALGRVVSVTTPDSAVLSKAYSGNQTTITDQAGKKRRGFANALGQTTKVVEDPDTLAYETTYLFDAAGNLRKTSQGTSGQMQYRYFSYDSLGRLLRSKQPEQGTNSGISFTDPLTGNTAWADSFTYDENGNILTRADARGVVTTFTYDELNRPLTKNFSDSTPDVTMTYDSSGAAYSKGKLTQVYSTISTTNITSFDRLGHVTGSSQTMAGISTPYNMSYSYGRNGTLLSETYPSGRVVTNTVDDTGQLSKVTSQETSQPERTYAQNFVYNSAGAIERLRLGNSRWENYQYNNRLQVTQIGLGASVGDTSLLKLDFEYNSTGNHDNNGALLKQTITLPGTTTVLTQSYTYDALNRLQSATEMFGSSQSWKQTFVFDRFGNRTFNTTSSATTTLPSSFSADIYNPTIDTSNNRYSSGQGYSYDAAGNVTANAAGQSFVYDAEQHQTEVRTTSTNALVASYKYDGSGQRVKKIVGTEETSFIYDAMGKSVAEYVLNSTTGPDVRTRYVTQDQLGSSRVITDGIGQVQERHDYHAYGEEASSSLSTVRTAAQKYAGTSAVRRRYTGYERDDESGLDYAQARYYNNAHGRFTSVDPLTASATIKNPQTFNRYSYALNSPYKFSDPLGLVSVTSGVADPEVNPDAAAQQQTTTTTSYSFTITHYQNNKDSGTIAEQVKVTIVETSVTTAQKYGTVTVTTATATAVQVGGANNLSQDRLDNIGNAAAQIVESSSGGGVDKAVALGIGAEESLLGGGSASGQNSKYPQKAPPINPMQLSEGGAIYTGSDPESRAWDLNHNTNGAVALYSSCLQTAHGNEHQALEYYAAGLKDTPQARKLKERVPTMERCIRDVRSGIAASSVTH
jgi:RHS repeat-associated protein